MKAQPILSEKEVGADGSLTEIVVWLLPSPVPPSQHDLKYRLVYVVDGERVIGFDNERGKGDHMHRRGVERPYEFRGLTQLLADFRAAVAAERGTS